MEIGWWGREEGGVRAKMQFKMGQWGGASQIGEEMAKANATILLKSNTASSRKGNNWSINNARAASSPSSSALSSFIFSIPLNLCFSLLLFVYVFIALFVFLSLHLKSKAHYYMLIYTLCGDYNYRF